jgi:predicted nuclease of predicted toxin-antitoxin system
MKILADVHISPRTVRFLRELGHDAVRVCDVMPASSPDAAIVARADSDGRVILTQDLGFSAIIALSGRAHPSVISLRLSSSRIERVNAVLPQIEDAARVGAIVSVEDHQIRCRDLPVNI